MINHSISNKMISLNSLNELSGENNPPEASRRRRTPSKYAESIRELTKMTSKNSKKERNSDSPEEETPPVNSNSSEKANVLACFFPRRNKKLKLSIIIKKSWKPKPKKATVPVWVEKEKEKEKEKPKNFSLLDTLLQVVEQYKTDEQNRRGEGSPKEQQAGSGEQEAGRKESRPRKEKEEEEKYARFYEKYRSLAEKFELMENEIILI